MDMAPTTENIRKATSANNIEFIILILRCSLDTINYQELGLVKNQNINWDKFNELIQFHNIGALIHRIVQDKNLTSLPVGTSNLLKKLHTNNVAGSLLLSSKISKIFKKFNSQDIPLMLIKGKAVEDWMYISEGIRSSGDIDLYIDTKDWRAATSCLNSMGYRMSHISDRLTINSKLSKQFIKSTKDVTFYDDNNVTVELHWRLSPNQKLFPLSFDEAWADRRVFEIRDTKVATLSNELHTIYLSYHVTMHRMEKLFWLYDIALFMKNDNKDWTKILDHAKHLNAENSLYIACVTASKVFQLPMPSTLVKQENIAKISEKLSVSIIPDILSENPLKPTSTKSLLKNISWRRHINPSQSSFLFGWYKFLTTPSIHDWESINLPDFLTPLYRVLRPLRLVIKALTN